MKHTYLIVTLGALAALSFHVHAVRLGEFVEKPVESLLPVRTTVTSPNTLIAEHASAGTKASTVIVNHENRPVGTERYGGTNARVGVTVDAVTGATRISHLLVADAASSASIAANLAKQLGLSSNLSEVSALKKAIDSVKQTGDLYQLNKTLIQIAKMQQKTIDEKQITQALHEAETTGTFTDLGNKVKSLFGSFFTPKSSKHNTGGPDTLAKMPENSIELSSKATADLEVLKSTNAKATGAESAKNAAKEALDKARNSTNQATEALNNVQANIEELKIRTKKANDLIKKNEGKELKKQIPKDKAAKLITKEIIFAQLKKNQRRIY